MKGLLLFTNFRLRNDKIVSLLKVHVSLFWYNEPFFVLHISEKPESVYKYTG